MTGDDELQQDSGFDDITADIRAAAEQASTKALAEKVVTTEVEIPDNETPEQKATRERDAAGRFVAKPVEQSAPVTIPDADPAQATIEQPSPAIGTPKAWSAEAKAEWSKLSPAVQQAVLKREQEMDSGGRQWSTEKRAYEQVFAPVQTLSQQYQMKPADVVDRLVTVERRLADPAQSAQVIAELADSYGVDLAALVNGTPQPKPAQQQFNPEIIPQIVQKQVTQSLQAWQENQAVTGMITTFGTEKDQTGQLKHPHFSNEDVKKRMGALLGSGLAKDLEDAYQQSIWASSDLRTTLMAPQQQTQQRTTQVAKAKAAKMPSGAPGGSPAKVNGFDPKQTLDDDIRESIAMHRH